MFDYLKRMKNREFEKPDEALKGKPKKDKVFIGILIIFGLMLIIGIVTGIGNVGAEKLPVSMDYNFKLNVTDIFMFLAVTIGYLIFKLRKGKK